VADILLRKETTVETVYSTQQADPLAAAEVVLVEQAELDQVGLDLHLQSQQHLSQEAVVVLVELVVLFLVLVAAAGEVVVV
jgi:hypothetical protein